MNRLWYLLNKQIKAGESVVIATIYNKSGSAPRTDGAKMLIQADGSITGTIGGGKLEAEAISLANQVFACKSSRVFEFKLLGSSAAEMDMICGGAGEVLLDYFDASNQINLEICCSIPDVLRKHEKAWLVTGMGPGLSGQQTIQRCFIKNDGTMIGEFECESNVLANLAYKTSKISVYYHVLHKHRILIEPIRSPEVLYVFGAGHVSRQIAILADMVGFQTVVLDDRAEFACKERFPDADVVLLSSFDDLFKQVQADQEGYFVIVTRGHMYDKTVLGQLLGIPSAYLGMIGSKRKRDMIYAALQEEQGIQAADLARVHCPVGLEIAAESPEEIAVSIIAELIKVRAEREPGRYELNE